MQLHLATWDNSLAVRLPAELVRRFGLKEGDTFEAHAAADGALTIRPATFSGGTRTATAQLATNTPVGPAKYVKPAVYERMSGYTVEAIHTKIKRGYWLEGHEYIRAPDGNILIYPGRSGAMGRRSETAGLTRLAEQLRLGSPAVNLSNGRTVEHSPSSWPRHARRCRQGGR